jgi:DNA repair exonuclease SbcCD ATPase subunit
MKRIYLLLFCVISSLFIACNQDKIDQLEEEKSALSEKTSQKDSIINEMLGSFNQIQENLNEIRAKEGEIEIKSYENAGKPKNIAKSINEDINRISELMRKNEALVDNLNNRMENAQVENSEIKRLIENLQTQLEQKNQTIAKLNQTLKEQKVQIGELYFSVDSLRFTGAMKDRKLEQKTDEIYEAYYAYGSFKELKEKNVVTKEGGVLGIGSTENLKDDFNKEYFSKIDTREQTSFLIYADKAEVITTHPKGSYKFVGDEKVDSLVITNPRDFWRASRYLVIVVD